MNRKYSVIYCDPPWQYGDKAKAGNRGAEFKYPCMSFNELVHMNEYIDQIREDNSVIFLWTTAPMMDKANSLLFAWGYDYKTVAFTWIKKTKNDKLFWGMGNHTRANAEFVLLGIRGKGVKRISASVHSIVEAPIREHSRKPDIIRDRIVELYGDVPRIEMFARQRTPGWDVHGSEVDKFKCTDSPCM